MGRMEQSAIQFRNILDKKQQTKDVFPSVVLCIKKLAQHAVPLRRVT